MSDHLTQLALLTTPTGSADPDELWDDDTALELAEKVHWIGLPASEASVAGTRTLVSFGETGRASLLALAISLLAEAYERADELPTDQRADAALCFGEALREGSIIFDEPEWLPDAIAVTEEAVRWDGHAWAWASLCETYRFAFRSGRGREHLDNALRCAREALDSAQPRDVSVMASNLGAVLMQAAGDPADPSLMDEALRAATTSVRRVWKADPNRAVYLSNLATVLSSMAERDGRVGMARRAVRWATRAVEAEPEAINAMLICASCHVTLGELTDEQAAFDEASALLARADVAARGTSRRSHVLVERSSLAQRCFERSGESEHLIAASWYADQAVALEGGQLKASSEALLNLAVCRTRLVESGLTGKLPSAPRLATLALAKANGDDRPRMAENVALVWLSHHERTGSKASLDGAIDLLRDAASAPSARPRVWSNLAGALLSAADLDPDEALVREATEAARRACAEVRRGSRDRAAFEAVLASCLETSFRVSHDLTELRDAARYARRATRRIDPRSPDAAAVWTNSAVALRTSYEHRGRSEDLQRAVQLLELALNVAGPAVRATCLSQLAATLRTRFEALGDHDDLAGAMSAANELAAFGVAITRGGAATISACHMAAYEVSGRVEQLDAAVHWGRMALTRRDRIAEIRAAAFTSLANALLSRFEVVGEEEDLVEALNRARQAVRVTPPTSPSLAGRHANLANVLRHRASLGRGSIRSALHAAETSVNLASPKDPNTPAYLSGLALVLSELGRHEQASDALRKAVALCRRASPARDFYRVNLATSLRDEWEAGGSKRSVGEAIRVLARVPNSDAPWAQVGLVVRGDCLQARGAAGDHASAVGCWAEVYDNDRAPAWLRLLAAKSAADVEASDAAAAGQPAAWSPAAATYHRAIALHEKAAWHGLAWPSRQRFLAAHENMGIDAAASALSAGDEPATAMARLEAGRAIVWRGRIARRSTASDDPLVARLRQIADELDALDRQGAMSATQGLP